MRVIKEVRDYEECVDWGLVDIPDCMYLELLSGLHWRSATMVEFGSTLYQCTMPNNWDCGDIFINRETKELWVEMPLVPEGDLDYTNYVEDPDQWMKVANVIRRLMGKDQLT